jgi:hypothetical protein
VLPVGAARDGSKEGRCVRIVTRGAQQIRCCQRRVCVSAVFMFLLCVWCGGGVRGAGGGGMHAMGVRGGGAWGVVGGVRGAHGHGGGVGVRGWRKGQTVERSPDKEDVSEARLCCGMLCKWDY